MADGDKIECQMRGLIEDLNTLRAERADLALAEEYGANSGEVNKRAYRRAIEKKLVAGVVPPGPWDQDWDDYPEEVYEGYLGNGFLGSLVRNNYSGTWCGYVIVPDGHWSIGKDLTNSWITYHEGNKIGFDSGNWGLKPIERVPEFSSENYWLPVQPGDHLEYITFNKAWNKVYELLEHINRCAPKKEPPRSYAQVVVGK